MTVLHSLAQTLAVLTVFATPAVAAEIPAAVAAPGEIAFVTLRGEGAQIYECKPGPDNTLSWQFREPVAALILDGKTVGRHYVGPNWELSDGSAVAAKAAGNAPGASPNDIPWLKLAIMEQRGKGLLADAVTIQRINTRGGQFAGACDKAGALHSAPYSADYVFLKKG